MPPARSVVADVGEADCLPWPLAAVDVAPVVCSGNLNHTSPVAGTITVTEAATATTVMEVRAADVLARAVEKQLGSGFCGVLRRLMAIGSAGTQRQSLCCRSKHAWQHLLCTV